MPHDQITSNQSYKPPSTTVQNLNDAFTCVIDETLLDGHWFCILCNKRGTGNKDSRPWGTSGRVHDTCRRRNSRGQIIQRSTHLKRPSQSSSSPSSITTKITKVELSLSSGASISSAICNEFVPVQSTETYSASLTRFEYFSKFASVRQPAVDETRKLAWKIMQLKRDVEKQGIAGKVTQLTPVEFEKNSASPMRLELETLVRKIAAENGILNAQKMHVVDTKLLIAPPNRGKQFVHWDRTRDRKISNAYTFLLCCTNGCHSTALPTFEANEILSFSNKPSEMRKVAHLLQDTPENYKSLPMEVGEIVLFKQTLPHYGVANSMPQENRVMLFCVLSEFPEWNQDTDQVPAWLFVGHAFGWISEEFASSLVANRAHDPITRIQSNQGDKDMNTALECLKTWKKEKLYKSRVKH